MYKNIKKNKNIKHKTITLACLACFIFLNYFTGTFSYMLQDKQVIDRLIKPTFKLINRGLFYAQLYKLYHEGVQKVCNIHIT